jgi:hypothetical protein
MKSDEARLLEKIGEARNMHEAAQALADRTREHRDALIRDAMVLGVYPISIAEASGLRTARLYQIRDGRR